jgi:hypothetical protein
VSHTPKTHRLLTTALAATLTGLASCGHAESPGQPVTSTSSPIVSSSTTPTTATVGSTEIGTSAPPDYHFCSPDNGIAPPPTASATLPLSSVAPVTKHRNPPFPNDPKAALADVLSRVTFASIVSARIGTPPPDACRTAPWLYVEAKVPSTEGTLGETARAEWESWLLTGAVAELSATGPNLADAVSGASIKYLLPDGSTGSTADSGVEPIGEMAAGQSFTDAADAVVVPKVTGVLKSFGLSPITVSVLHPVDDALVVIASTPSPDALHGQVQELTAQLSGNFVEYEGIYLEIRLPDGQPIYRSGGAARYGAGLEWVKPGLWKQVGATPPPGSGPCCAPTTGSS